MFSNFYILKSFDIKIRSRLWIIDRKNKIFVDKSTIYQLKTIIESDILVMLATPSVKN